MIRCEWNWADTPGSRCFFEAWHLVVFGCLNGHMNEQTICAHHRLMWNDADNCRYLHCPECTLLVTEWETTHLTGLINYKRPTSNQVVRVES
jgi:hypothetical protein